MIEEIKTFGIINTLKFAWQRVFRGYDDTFMWGMDEYLNYYFMPAIKEFCIKRLKETIDEKFIKVYKEMLEKITAWEEAGKDPKCSDFYNYPNKNSEMWSYFGNNITYFWD